MSVTFLKAINFNFKSNILLRVGSNFEKVAFDKLKDHILFVGDCKHIFRNFAF